MEKVLAIIALLFLVVFVRSLWKREFLTAAVAFGLFFGAGAWMNTLEKGANATITNAQSDGRLTPSKEFIWIRGNQRLVAAKLKDPDSAEFGSSDRVSYKTGGPVVCGTVNAKNSFGGYGGPQRYIGMGDIGVYLASEVRDFGKLWNKVCD